MRLIQRISKASQFAVNKFKWHYNALHCITKTISQPTVFHYTELNIHECVVFCPYLHSCGLNLNSNLKILILFANYIKLFDGVDDVSLSFLLVLLKEEVQR